MTEQTQASEAKASRTALFGRTYNHKDGAVKFEVAGFPVYDTAASVVSLPDEVRNSFALLGFADYMAQRGNKVKRDGGTTEDAVKALRQAAEDAAAGKVEFSDGIGLGMASAPATLLVGRALVETGRKFTAWNGTRYDFEGDVSKAQDAMAALYNDTVERTIKVKDKEVKMSGRQFYNQIANLPDIVEKVASYKKSKGAATPSDEMLG